MMNQVNKFSIAVDLTKKRHSILTKAREFIKNNEKVSHVLADINCSLVVKLTNGKLCYFNSESELIKVLDRE